MDAKRELQRIQEHLWVLQAQDRSQDVFRNLVVLYERRILYYVRRLLEGDDGAADVAQEVWLIAFAVAAFVDAMGCELSTTFNMVWLIALTASPLCAVWFLVVYLVKYRPAVGQTRTEFQNAIILQLQQQVADLTERLSIAGK